jgi:hypothetical protein
VLVFAFLSWLLVVGSSIAVAVRTEGANIDGTKFCMKTIQDGDVSNIVNTYTRFIFDTLIFTATSWWLMKESTGDRGFKTFVFGRHLGPLTRSLLQDGQAYYLFVFSTSI